MTARVTVGVPVYNGEAFLEECFAALRDQTFDDFEVLIFDNASTDRTAEIAHDFIATDPRFIYHRKAETSPPGTNFLDVAEAARGTYFLWRAHDDLSSSDYIEALVAVLDAVPEAQLVASRVRSTRLSPEGVVLKSREIAFQMSSATMRLQRLKETLDLMHQSWLYGLWRREAAVETWRRIYRAYPHAWASDFLMLFGLAARDQIVGTDNALFIQRIMIKAAQHDTQKAATTATTMYTRRADFITLCQSEMRAAGFTDAELRQAEPVLERFASARVYSRSKIWRARLGF